jgi:nucleoside-diphosphate-sugar epimerase
MKYLITGGAGFIGSNIAARLVKMGEQVRILDNFSSGKLENLADFANQIEIIDGDIRDYWTVCEAVSDIDYVLHQAALPSVPRSIANPLTSNEVNINGLLNVLNAARHAGVKKMVYASSSSIYGESEELPKHEGMTPSPLSPYAVTKLTGEYYCKVFSGLYSFPTVALRYFNIFGPRQDPQSQYAAVVPQFVTRLLNDQSPVVYGDGEQSRDFTFVDNCVQANILAATNDQLVGEQYNVACGGQFTLNQLIDKLRKIIGVSTKAEYTPAREGDIKHSFAAVDKLAAAGYAPQVSFDDGLKLTVDFYRQQQKHSGVPTA